MEKVYVGKIVNTFGIKGELKVATNFECQEKVFKKGLTILINDEEHLISSVRYHKDHYLITIDELDNINLVLKYKGYNIHVLRKNLELKEDEYLMNDLLNMQIVENDIIIGNVTEVINEVNNPLIKINNEFYIPLKANYIIKVDNIKKIIYTNNIKELML